MREHQPKFWLDICTCKFVGVGRPMDERECKIHTKHQYPCPSTGCPNYRPKREFTPLSSQWPLCVCGEIAQEHNTVEPVKL